MTASAFTVIFSGFLLLTLGLRLWLAWRQARHVGQARAAVPLAFADKIPLEAHQKAADYTRARLAVGVFELFAETALLLALTFGGGLQFVHERWSEVLPSGGLWHGIAFLATLSVLSSVIGLPFSIWNTFVTEAKFGFNKTTPLTFINDL